MVHMDFSPNRRLSGTFSRYRDCKEILGSHEIRHDTGMILRNSDILGFGLHALVT